ncbi:hypothetical protein NDU88_003107 [Pleurodeles waltl]|uniref:Uncharacterized protein n=1 Tax=Pleurodeles waltl TaxID=8319 RepID=A0AAV7SDW9_PLEWA|nr:hypothetical protein NDU88_003107 [Pleurodeles waltl]
MGQLIAFTGRLLAVWTGAKWWTSPWLGGQDDDLASNPHIAGKSIPILTYLTHHERGMEKLRAKQAGDQPEVTEAAPNAKGESVDPEKMDPPMQLQLDVILAAIVDTKTALQQDIGAVLVRLGLLRAEDHKLVDSVKGIESGLKELQLSQLEMVLDGPCLNIMPESFADRDHRDQLMRISGFEQACVLPAIRAFLRRFKVPV